jgi:hypothetical protein
LFAGTLRLPTRKFGSDHIVLKNVKSLAASNRILPALSVGAIALEAIRQGRRVAVGFRSRDHLDSDVAAVAAAVLDYELLPGDLRQLRSRTGATACRSDRPRDRD